MRVLANELIETLDEPADVDALTRRYMNNQALSDAEFEGLSPQARTVARLLDGTTPDEAAALYAELPGDFRKDLKEISPSAHVGDIRARLLVLHDRHDRLVPAAESRRLLAATEDRGDVPLHRGARLRARPAQRRRDWRPSGRGVPAVPATCTTSFVSPTDGLSAIFPVSRD